MLKDTIFRFGRHLQGRKIDAIDIRRQTYPLEKPYSFSFATWTDYTSINMDIRLSDGEQRTGEVVAFYGSSDESENAIYNHMQQQAQELVGTSAQDARVQLQSKIAERPYSVTAALTALDLFDFDDVSLDEPSTGFVKAVSTENLHELAVAMSDPNAVRGTYKLKLTGKPDKDISAMSLLEPLAQAANIRLRFDANQAYELSDARKTMSWLASSPLLELVDYIEQPVKDNDWNAIETLSNEFDRVAIMLDESIVVVDDLKRAEDIGIRFVKLKLFKQGGIKELLELASNAAARNVHVVLGNGVATGLSNRIEIGLHRKFPESFFGASEANGFSKITDGSRAAD